MNQILIDKIADLGNKIVDKVNQSKQLNLPFAVGYELDKLRFKIGTIAEITGLNQHQGTPVVGSNPIPNISLTQFKNELQGMGSDIEEFVSLLFEDAEENGVTEDNKAVVEHCIISLFEINRFTVYSELYTV